MKWDEAPALSADITAVRGVESNNNPNAVSPKGARGLMQVMPGTNTDPGFGVRPAQDDSEAERTRVGEDYLTILQHKYGREGGLQAYNMGPGAYEKMLAGKRSMPAETAAYVPKVNAKGGKPSMSWQDAPEAPSEGGASQIPGVPNVEVRGTSTDEQPSILQRAKAAAGRLVDQAQTKEGWKAAGQAAVNSALDIPNALVTGAGKFVAPAVGAVQDVISGNKLGTGNQQIQQDIAGFAQDTARDPNSIGYRATATVPEMVATAAPIAKAGQVAARVLPKALGVAAPAIGDIAANAAYSGGRAALEGKDTGEVLSEAGTGAAGAAAGRGVMAVAGGAKSALPQARQLLVERGMLPSAGQILGGGAETLERGFARIPGLGRAIGAKGALEDSARTFSTADVNRAMEGTGFKTAKTGELAVNDAVDHLDTKFGQLIDQTRMGPRAANRAVMDALTKTLGARNPTNELKWVQALEEVSNETNALTRTMGWKDGRLAKEVDKSLSLRERQTAENDPQLSRVFKTVKQELRKGLTPAPGAPAGVLEDLQRTNVARAKLYPLEEARTHGIAGGGNFTPAESYVAQAKAGRAPTRDEANREARKMLEHNLAPDATTYIGLAGGGAGALMGASHIGDFARGVMSLSPGTTAAATAGLSAGAVARLANTRAGRQLILHGLAGGLPEGGIRRIVQSQRAAQLAAQAGREANQ